MGQAIVQLSEATSNYQALTEGVRRIGMDPDMLIRGSRSQMAAAGGANGQQQGSAANLSSLLVGGASMIGFGGALGRGIASSAQLGGGSFAPGAVVGPGAQSPYVAKAGATNPFRSGGDGSSVSGGGGGFASGGEASQALSAVASLVSGLPAVPEASSPTGAGGVAASGRRPPTAPRRGGGIADEASAGQLGSQPSAGRVSGSQVGGGSRAASAGQLAQGATSGARRGSGAGSRPASGHDATGEWSAGMGSGSDGTAPAGYSLDGTAASSDGAASVVPRLAIASGGSPSGGRRPGASAGSSLQASPRVPGGGGSAVASAAPTPRRPSGLALFDAPPEPLAAQPTLGALLEGYASTNAINLFGDVPRGGSFSRLADALEQHPNVRPRALEWLLKVIESLYKAKIVNDDNKGKSGQARLPFVDFVLQHLYGMYGKREIVAKNAAVITATVRTRVTTDSMR